MLNAVIIDDEVSSRETLKNLLTNFCTSVTVIGEAGSVDEGISVINTTNPDVVFLDIEMPYKNGFDLLSSLSEINFDVVFTTAYNQYALKAIKFSALDYLLKPINATELNNAVSRISAKRVAENKGKNNGKLDAFMANMKNINSQLQKMVIPTINGFNVVELKDIVRCESDRSYTAFHFTDKKSILLSKAIGDFEDLLDEHNFMRVHQSHLINLAHVKSYTKGRGGSVEMSDGSIIDISRNKREEFIEKFTLRL